MTIKAEDSMDMNPFQKWILRSFDLLSVIYFKATGFTRIHCSQIIWITKASFDSALLVFIPLSSDDTGVLKNIKANRENS